MKNYFTYKIALLGILALSGILYIIHPKPHSGSDTAANSGSGNNPVVTSVPSDTSGTGDGNNASEPPEATPESTPVPTETPLGDELTLNIRGVSISLGDISDSVLKKLGEPGRIDKTEYDFEYYIYNNDYKKFVIIAVKDRKVAGFYTDSLDFDFHGITYGSDIGTVNHVLGESFSVSQVLTHKTDKADIRVLFDKLKTQKAVGVYVLAKNVKMNGYDDTSIQSAEQLSYDLVNSERARNDIPVLSWASSAARSARRHSEDMAKNNFFGHTNPKWQTPGDRLINEGVTYTQVGENIGSGYNSVILACHAWYNSQDNRRNLLNMKYRYLGAGFAYDAKSQYKYYLTQVYYR